MMIEISDIEAPELQIYSSLSEPQLYHYFEPEQGIFIAESPKVIERALNAGYKPLSMLLEKQCPSEETLRILTLVGDIPVYTADSSLLTRITGYKLTRGALCAMRRRELESAERICCSAKRIAVLEDVVNPTNVGAIFRSAAALSIDAVLLTPACSDPLYRRAARVSMGTVFQVPWTYIENIGVLKKLGFRTAAMALSDCAVSIEDSRLSAEEKLAIVLGTEGDGLSESTIAACDYTVRIPMAEGIDSLNVAAASAVAFWELRRNKHYIS